MDTLHTLFYFIVAIAVLVAFHEFGHFWVARKVGVKVIRFSIGFGKPLLAWRKSAEDTEFVIAAVPLGGYVKMVDEREEAVKEADLPFAFNRQPLWARTAVVAAGPLFNLLLAVLLFWAVLVIGEVGVKPLIGGVEPGSLAEQVGLIKGDEIVAINEKTTPTWIETFDVLLSAAIVGQREISITTKSADDSRQTHILQLTDQDAATPEGLHKRLGLKPWSPKIKPVVGKLMEDGVAKQAGLQPGDLLVNADGVDISDWQQWVDYVQARPEIAINLTIERSGVRSLLTLTPRREQQKDGTSIGKIGAGVETPQDVLDSLLVKHSLSPLDAVPAAFERTWFYAVNTLKMMGKMLVGSASVENLSGPISIAQYAGQSADMGLTAFLKFLGLVSVSLGVLNLLPVPVLDGGHLLFFAVEAVKGSPVPEKLQIYFQQVGMVLLMLLMALAMFLDIDRLFQ